MITQYLINFLKKQHDPQTQKAMMLSLSKILQFSEEEKVSLGIDSNQKAAKAPQQKGFGLSLMSYMMNGDDDDDDWIVQYKFTFKISIDQLEIKLKDFLWC